MQAQPELSVRIHEIYARNAPDHFEPFIGEAYRVAMPDYLRVLCVGINNYVSPADWERKQPTWFVHGFTNQMHRFDKGVVRDTGDLSAAVTAHGHLFAGLTFEWRKSLYVTNAIKVYVPIAEGKRAVQVHDRFAAHAPQWRDEVTALIDAGVPPHVVVVFGEIFWPNICESFGHAGVLDSKVAAYESVVDDVKLPIRRITLIGGHVMLLVRLRHPSRTNGKVTAAYLQQLPSFSRMCAKPPDQAPNDAEALNEHTRARLEGDAMVIEAATVAWHGPHTPHSSWLEVARLPASATEVDVDHHRRQLLAREDLFVICVGCGDRELLGDTHDRKCHPCMERDGVVF